MAGLVKASTGADDRLVLLCIWRGGGQVAQHRFYHLGIALVLGALASGLNDPFPLHHIQLSGLQHGKDMGIAL